MVSLQGKASAMMECWHTKAERLPTRRQAALCERAFPGHPPSPERQGPPGGLQAERLTKVGLFICSFEMHPFGRRLDEEVADKVTVVLSWSQKEEGVYVRVPQPCYETLTNSFPDPPPLGPSSG